MPPSPTEISFILNQINAWLINCININVIIQTSINFKEGKAKLRLNTD